MRLPVPLAAATLLLFAAAPPALFAQTGVQGLADAWSLAYNAHDRGALGALYAEDARLMMHGAPSYRGRQSIEEFWSTDFQEGNPLTLLTVTNAVTGPDMTLVHGDYRVIDRDDGSLLGSGRFAHLWSRVDRDWKLDRDLWNQPFEPYAETSLATDVQALADRWVEAYNRHDRQALAAIYSQDAALMMHGAPSFTGRAAIGEFWAQDFEEGNPLTLITVTHAVDGSDMVLVHGNYEVVDREDGALLGLGRVAHIWLQGPDGQWQLDRDMWVERSVPFEFD